MNNQNKLILQTLLEEDVPRVVNTFNFPWTTLQATKDKWNHYYSEQQRNVRMVCIAKIQDKYVGYGSLLWVSEYPEFKNTNIPEIKDVWVSAKHRGNGFGKKLICYLEEIARQKNHKQIGIGVGLYKDYGSAQKLYIQLGYNLDGMGITYKCQPVVPGDSYPVDDDLVIWLKKDLL